MNVLLRILSRLFGVIVLIRNRLYDRGYLQSVRLPGKVISVGNVAIGGTGKSPVVIDIARKIVEAGGVPAILTRGYRSGLAASEWQVLLDGKVAAGVNRADVIADEAIMQSSSLPRVPVIVGRKRLEAARNFINSCPQFNVTHWILDDGFQHRKITRDVDVVLLDARTPYGELIPAGRFREPLASLKRAHIAVMTKAERVTQTETLRRDIQAASSNCEIMEARFVTDPPRLVLGASTQSPMKWGLVAGIANPNDFVASAKDHGVVAVDSCFVQDHHPFPLDKLESFTATCDALLTTEKDFARSSSVFRRLKIPVYVLPLRVEWVGGMKFFSDIVP